jgi:hypothetical protein
MRQAIVLRSWIIGLLLFGIAVVVVGVNALTRDQAVPAQQTADEVFQIAWDYAETQEQRPGLSLLQDCVVVDERELPSAKDVRYLGDGTWVVPLRVCRFTVDDTTSQVVSLNGIPLTGAAQAD